MKQFWGLLGSAICSLFVNLEMKQFVKVIDKSEAPESPEATESTGAPGTPGAPEATGTNGAPDEKQDTVNWALEDMQFSVDPESYHKKISAPKAAESEVALD